MYQIGIELSDFLLNYKNILVKKDEDGEYLVYLYGDNNKEFHRLMEFKNGRLVGPPDLLQGLDEGKILLTEVLSSRSM